MKHTLPKLPYDYNELEPFFDAKTMEIHHTKHHQTYVDKLNATLEKYPELQEKEVSDLMREINQIPKEINMAVRNHGGGHINHSFFWEILSPTEQEIGGEISDAINETFGSFEEFKKKFSDSAMSRFGSGWAWLVVNAELELKIISTSNQDSPLMEGNNPILGIDVWEHAYYLKYQNKRADYIAAFFNIINWKKVNELYEEIVG